MVEFTKMNGLGNDYIYINQLDDKNIIRNIEPFTRYICDRHFGVGADGVILIKNSSVADLKMKIYNSDGSQAQMCGNGIRCFGKYVYENNIIKRNKISVETMAGIKDLQLHIKNGEVQEVTVNMGRPTWNNSDEFVKIKAIDLDVEGMCVSMGNPHFVIFTKDVEKIDIKKYGSFIENYNLFPERTNVEFIQVFGIYTIKMRVWERGSGETLACGTGACAAFAVCKKLNLVKNNVKVLLKGGELKVELDNYTNDIYMTGIATKVFDGKIENPLVY